MKKLIVSGCSWGDPNFMSMPHPAMDTTWPKWPEILAEMMNLEPMNLCLSGMGQEYIYSSISDVLSEIDINEVGYVIAAWTSAPRRDYEKTDMWRGAKFGDVKNVKKVKRWHNIRTDAKGDLQYWIRKTIRYQYAFQNLMEQHKKRVADQALFYKHVQMISLIKGHIWEVINNLDYSGLEENDLQMKLDKFQQFAELQKYGREFVRDMLTEAYIDTLKKSKYKFNEHFLGWPTDESLGGYMIEQYLTEEYRISEQDRHPNAVGQQKIAELIYDRLG